MAYYYAQLNEESFCVGVGSYPVEVEKDNFIAIDSVDTNLLGCKYENGVWTKVEAETEVEEISEEELVQAELLLNQMTILENQSYQDEVLAEILLNQMQG